jgi:hypothetical protein
MAFLSGISEDEGLRIQPLSIHYLFNNLPKEEFFVHLAYKRRKAVERL